MSLRNNYMILDISNNNNDLVVSSTTTDEITIAASTPYNYNIINPLFCDRYAYNYNCLDRSNINKLKLDSYWQNDYAANSLNNQLNIVVFNNGNIKTPNGSINYFITNPYFISFWLKPYLTTTATLINFPNFTLNFKCIEDPNSKYYTLSYVFTVSSLAPYTYVFNVLTLKNFRNISFFFRTTSLEIYDNFYLSNIFNFATQTINFSVYSYIISNNSSYLDLHQIRDYYHSYIDNTNVYKDMMTLKSYNIKYLYRYGGLDLTNINLLFVFKGVFMQQAQGQQMVILNLASANLNMGMDSGIQISGLMISAKFYSLQSDDDIDNRKKYFKIR